MANIKPGDRKWVGFNLTGDIGPFTVYTSRRSGTVWFLKAPPEEPPSVRQLHYRNRFRQAAAAWNMLPQSRRDDWNLAARKADLYVHGYALWVYWQLTRQRATIRTIERQTGITLIPT